MLRSTIVLVILAAAVFSTPIPDFKESFEKLPSDFKSLVPDEVSDFIKSLSEEDGNIMKDIAKKYKEYKNEDDMLNALKHRSPALHEKAEKLHKVVEEKLKKVNNEARMFLKKAMAEARRIHNQFVAGETPSLDTLKNTAKARFDEYKGLSQAAKDSIAKEFPTFSELANKAAAVVGNQ